MIQPKIFLLFICFVSTALMASIPQTRNSFEPEIEGMVQELKSALPATIKREKTEEGRTISFRKILYKGVLFLNRDKTSAFAIAGHFPSTLLSSASLNYLVLGQVDKKIYPCQLQYGKEHDFVKINQAISVDKSQFSQFYIVSEPIRYQCNSLQKTSLSAGKESTVVKEIESCDFTFFHDTAYQGLILYFTPKNPNDAPIVRPVIFE